MTKVRSSLRRFFDGFTGDNALSFTLGDHDVRVDRGQWVYYIRAVHRGQWLRQDLNPVMGLPSLVIYVLFSGFVDDWRARRPWKVGVLRRRSRGTRRAFQILHKDVLPPGQGPQGRVAQLAAMVNAGEFDSR